MVADFVQAADERFARLEADVADLKAGQARLETALAEFMEATNRRLDQLEAGQARLETALAEFMEATNRRLDRLEAGQARLEAALAEFMAATNRRLDQLEAGQARLETALAEFMAATNRRLDRLETALAEFMEATNRRLDQLEAGQARLETALAEFMEATNRRLDQLEAGQARLEADFADLKAGQERLEADFDRMKTTQTRMQGTLGRLVGAELEREVHANIISIASRELGLNRARILQSKLVARGPELQDRIDDAEEQGLISAEQGSHLERADIIIKARRKSDGQDCYAVLEISAGIRNSDITRARDRAQTLADIQDLPVIPAVVGGTIAAPQRNLADRDGVRVIITLRMVPRPLDTDDAAGA